MTRLPQPSLIAIDGGGTACRFLLVLGERRFRHDEGAANVHSAPQAARDTLLRGLRALTEAAGLTFEDLAGVPIYAGLAGVADAAGAARIARHLPSRRVRVENDSRAAVAGALGDAPGCVAGIGTGSYLARQGPGGFRLIGGHGLLLGDEASGGWLGLRLLRQVLLAADGLAPQSDLSRACFAEFGDDPVRIMAFAAGATPGDYGRWAPRVVAAAKAGDALAAALMREGADYLIAGLAALGCSEDEPLCLTGGVGPCYAPYLAKAGLGNIIAPRGSALDGALLLAQRMTEAPHEP